MKRVYYEKEDALHLATSDEPQKRSMELGSNITAELNDYHELKGIEILNARGFNRDSVFNSLQAKMLSLAEVESTRTSLLNALPSRLLNAC